MVVDNVRGMARKLRIALQGVSPEGIKTGCNGAGI